MCCTHTGQVYKIDTLHPVDYAVDDDGDEVTVRLSIRGHGKVRVCELGGPNA